MSRGRHSAAPATARSFRLPALPTLPVRSLSFPRWRSSRCSARVPWARAPSLRRATPTSLR